VIKQVAEGIMTQYNGSQALKRALWSGLWHQQAPETVTISWGVFYIIGVSDEEIAGTADDNLRDVSVQFSLFSETTDGGENIALLVRLLTEAFDWCNFRANGYAVHKCQRDSIGSILYTDEIWQGTVDYTIGMQKE